LWSCFVSFYDFSIGLWSCFVSLWYLFSFFHLIIFISAIFALRNWMTLLTSSWWS
jgi:hypothetical protein